MAYFWVPYWQGVTRISYAGILTFGAFGISNLREHPKFGNLKLYGGSQAGLQAWEESNLGASNFGAL
jgi:hypothetical protein